MDAEVAREIGRAITAALSRRGVAGTVVVRGNHAEVHAPGLDVLAIELDWISQWNLLPPEMQQKRADHAAERLQEVMRAARGQGVRRSFDIGALVRPVFVPAIALIIVGTLGWWLWRSNFFGRGFFGTAAGDASASVDPQAEERARRQRSCEAGRRRLFAGADMGLDVDGWVVELWLARPVDRGALETDAALARAIENARSAFKEGPGELTIGRAEHRGGLGLESAVVRMSGVFVSAFFETTRRV
ncbi:MAG TPA: hypothetical protein VFB62_20920, partial [Polyangiaceae bacterium]|nr:hypothetical protein [Polyangiaceae bacterium]